MSDPLAQLLHALGGIDRADIGRLPGNLIDEAIESLQLPLADRARLHLLLPGPAKEGDLGAYFLRQEERTRDPWRVHLERALALANTAAQATDKELERSFVDAARAQLITPADAFSANYALFGSQDAQKFFLTISLLPYTERMRMHNFFIANSCGNDFLTTFGEQLISLQFPLFPPLPSLRALNIKLLTEGRTNGGSTREPYPSVFRQETEGGMVLPVQTDEAGRSFVDVAAIEQAFSQLNDAVRELRTRVASDALLASLLQKISSKAQHCRNVARGRSAVAPRQVQRGRPHQRNPSRTSGGTDKEDAADHEAPKTTF